MPDHRIGTREEWQAARAELAKLEAEHAELGQKVTEQRRQLPWVPVEKEYVFDTEDGKKTLAELFDGRSQLLAYNIMFGPDYELGACPGCSNLGRRARRHARASEPPRRDADLLLARADRSADRLQGADGLAVPLRLDLRDRVSVRLRARADAGAGAGDPRGQGDDRRPARVAARSGARQIGAKLEDGLREGPGFIAFARDNGSVFHTYTVMAPDPFVAPYHSFLLERTPKAESRGAPRLAQGRVPGLIAAPSRAHAAMACARPSSARP